MTNLLSSCSEWSTYWLLRAVRIDMCPVCVGTCLECHAQQYYYSTRPTASLVARGGVFVWHGVSTPEALTAGVTASSLHLQLPERPSQSQMRYMCTGA